MADYYSRSPGGAGLSVYLMEIKSERYVSIIVVQAAIPTAIKTTQKIAEATSLESELSELRQAITTGKR
jgi:hypothetical protein